MTHALRIRLNALVLVAVVLVGLVILPGTPDVKPGSSVVAWTVLRARPQVTPVGDPRGIDGQPLVSKEEG